MTWPTNLGNTFTGNASANISDARSEIDDTIIAVNEIIDARGAVSGIAALNSNGLIQANNIPATFSSPSNQNLTLQPGSDRVKIQNIVNLDPQTTTTIENISNPASGDVVFCNDGDSGSPCLAVYDGTDWLRVLLGNAISTT